MIINVYQIHILFNFNFHKFKKKSNETQVNNFFFHTEKHILVICIVNQRIHIHAICTELQIHLHKTILAIEFFRNKDKNITKSGLYSPTKNFKTPTYESRSQNIQT